MSQSIANKERRHFLKSVGAAGLTTLLAAQGAEAGTNPSGSATGLEQIPRRKLGRSGIEVPILSHGLMYDVTDRQIVLHKALQWGVSQWDTAHSYANGNSELGVGKFLARNPQVRRELFLVTKASGARSVDDLDKRLQTSLKRMNTSYIDLYYGVHGLSHPSQLTPALKRWAVNAKKRGLIRCFGFSTHSNMAQCLEAAAKLDWIDAVMTSYNFRLRQDPQLDAAISACHQAGIGVIAMKTQGRTIRSSDDKRLTDHFLAAGYTEGQAKLKAVLEDERISAACITMQNVALLTSNVAALLDQAKLSSGDHTMLQDHALLTGNSYCSGCSHLCNPTLAGTVDLSAVMRFLMYYNSYGDREKARALFQALPEKEKVSLLQQDYSQAEGLCPQRLPIAGLVREAVEKLA